MTNSSQTTVAGFIGAGAIAQAIATRLLAVDIEVVLSNSRGPDSLNAVVASLGTGARAGSISDAAGADITFLAVPWNKVADALSGLGVWNGQIVVDTTNPLWPPLFQKVDLNGRSSTEHVTDLLPGARVVKAFNTLRPDVVALDPHVSGGRRVIFVSGDHPDANSEVETMIACAGFAPIVLGDLSVGGRLQEFPGGPLPTLDLVRMS